MMQWADKPVRYEEHAMRRMAARKVAMEEVEKVIRGKHSRTRAKREGALKLEMDLSHRKRLALIVEEAPTFIRIVSAFWK
jgi:hypothetical protein